jgi:GDPmannose 4,6-dehydratase
MKRALICGLTGQDGAYLSQHLLLEGYEVFGGTRGNPNHFPNNLVALGIENCVSMVQLDLMDLRCVEKVFRNIRPDEIYNLSGPSSVGQSFENPQTYIQNITIGTFNILKATALIGAKPKLYFAGSSECFGDTGNLAANESTPFRPRSPYGIAKLAAYWAVVNFREAYNIFACTGLLFNHESPLRPERFVTRKVVAAALRIASGSGERLRLGNISIERDWGWAPDYVKMMWLMLQREQPNDYVIATGTANTLDNFVRVTFAKLGLDYKDYIDHDPSLLRPTEILRSCGDASFARQQLGWVASYSMSDIIEELIAAERSGTG